MPIQARFSRIVAAVLLLCAGTPAWSAGPAAVGGGPAVVPDRTIILLTEELDRLWTQGQQAENGPEAEEVLSTSRSDLLRQIAAASRTQAKLQLLIIKQNNEIIRQLEELNRGLSRRNR
ncbi:MAG: hypothetical protein HY039_10585 [Nitrospirae bacterium]|nr:hypothetical protein [Nitrospirota bacterium]